MFTNEEIRKYVEDNKEEAIECLKEAIQSPSPTGFEKPMADTMRKWLNKAGLDIKEYCYMENRPNFIADWNGSTAGKEGSKKFLFNGHMDVFPPTDTDDEGYSPWSGEIKDGYMYGRGTSDMKGGDCAAMMAVKFLKEMGFDPNGTITLNYVVDEENGGKYGALSLLNEGLLNADYGISMEPSLCNFMSGHGAVYPCKITVYGDSGHGCEDIAPGAEYGSEDAIVKAVKAVNALHALQKDVLSKRKTRFGTHLSVTKIHAGNAVNVHPGECEICIDRRFSYPETLESVDKEICDTLDEIKKGDPTFKYVFEGFYEPMTPEYVTDLESDIALALKDAHKYLYGTEMSSFTLPGGCDIAYIKEKYGFEAPWVGPGFIEGIATKEERISLEHYLNCIMMYMITMVKLMSK